MGSDSSRAARILTARAGERWRRPLPAGRARAESRQQHRRDKHTQRQEEALAFTERGDGFGPAAGQQFEESLLQRFFSLDWRVAWKKEGVTKQKS